MSEGQTEKPPSTISKVRKKIFPQKIAGVKITDSLSDSTIQFLKEHATLADQMRQEPDRDRRSALEAEFWRKQVEKVSSFDFEKSKDEPIELIEAVFDNFELEAEEYQEEFEKTGDERFRRASQYFLRFTAKFREQLEKYRKKLEEQNEQPKSYLDREKFRACSEEKKRDGIKACLVKAKDWEEKYRKRKGEVGRNFEDKILREYGTFWKLNLRLAKGLEAQLQKSEE